MKQSSYLNGLFLVTRDNLKDIDRDILPKKFIFEPYDGENIKISRENFSFICRGFFINKDDMDLNPNDFFIHCLMINAVNSLASSCLLSSNINDKKNVLVDKIKGHFPVFYTKKMVNHGVVVFKIKNKWNFYFIKGIHLGKISAINSFLEVPDNTPESDKMNFSFISPKLVDVTYSGVTGKILEMLFRPDTKLISGELWAEINNVIFLSRKSGFNVIRIDTPELEQVFKDDLCDDISFVMADLGIPSYNCSYYYDAVLIYERLKKELDGVVYFYNKEGFKEYFNLKTNSFLSESMAKEVEREIEIYKRELWSAEEFDYLE